MRVDLLLNNNDQPSWRWGITVAKKGRDPGTAATWLNMDSLPKNTDRCIGSPCGVRAPTNTVCLRDGTIIVLCMNHETLLCIPIMEKEAQKYSDAFLQKLSKDTNFAGGGPGHGEQESRISSSPLARQG